MSSLMESTVRSKSAAPRSANLAKRLTPSGAKVGVLMMGTSREGQWIWYRSM